jgi:hypothetical protein
MLYFGGTGSLQAKPKEAPLILFFSSLELLAIIFQSA